MRMTKLAIFFVLCGIICGVLVSKCIANEEKLFASTSVLSGELTSGAPVRRSLAAILTSSSSAMSVSLQVQKMFQDLNDLALPTRIQQLEGWVSIRERIDENSVKTAVLGENISLLIAEAVFAWLEDYVQLVGKDVLPSTQAEELLKSLGKINRRNATANRESIDTMLAAEPDADSEDLDLVRFRLLKQIDEESERSYVKRYGENVLAMQKAGNKSTFARGFQACIESLPSNCSEIENEPKSLGTIAYFLAVEHYVFALSQHVQKSLGGLLGVSDELPVKGSAFPNELHDYAKIRMQVLTYDDNKGGIWNRLFLKDDRQDE